VGVVPIRWHVSGKEKIEKIRFVNLAEAVLHRAGWKRWGEKKREERRVRSGEKMTTCDYEKGEHVEKRPKTRTLKGIEEKVIVGGEGRDFHRLQKTRV